MCCEVLPQYMYVLQAYLTVKTYVLCGVLERQTRRRPRGRILGCATILFVCL